MQDIEDWLIVCGIEMAARVARDPKVGAILSVCHPRMIEEARKTGEKYLRAARELLNIIAGREDGFRHIKSQIYNEMFDEYQFDQRPVLKSQEEKFKDADLTFRFAHAVLTKLREKGQKLVIHCITGDDRATAVAWGIIFNALKSKDNPLPVVQALTILHRLNPFTNPRSVTRILDFESDPEVKKMIAAELYQYREISYKLMQAKNSAENSGFVSLPAFIKAAEQGLLKPHLSGLADNLRDDCQRYDISMCQYVM